MDTTKNDTEPLRHLSLCAGYGGIDLGLRRVLPACRTVAYVEIECFAVWNLVKKMEAGVLDPAPVWTDLKTMPLGQLRQLLGRNSLISGGFPCQPFSSAGQNKGDEDPRHLFPYIKDAVRTIQPRWVFLENVEGIISAKLKGDNWADPAGTPVLLHVLRELERLGYRATWGIFSAAEVGLPHQRKRVFILAHSISKGLERQSRNEQEATRQIGIRANRPTSTGSVSPARPGQQQYWWEPPRVIMGNPNSHEQTQKPRVTEPQVCGDPHGAADWLDYAELCYSVDNRTDGLRLLGNGVVPATAAKAFRTLYERIANG